LRLGSVLESAEEGLDPPVLFDPLEEQFALRAAAIKLRHREGWQGEAVGEKDQDLGGLGIVEANPSQWRFEALARVEAGENVGLIADHSRGAVDRMRVTPLDLEIDLPRVTKKLPAS
jgi:hypothetical protein